MCTTLFTKSELLEYVSECIIKVYKNPSKRNFKLYQDAVEVLQKYYDRNGVHEINWNLILWTKWTYETSHS